MEQSKHTKTRKVMTLFIGAALMLGTTACSDTDCVDSNRDGYCDSSGGGSSSGYYGSSSGSKSKSTSGISSGSHGGIGSSGSSSS